MRLVVTMKLIGWTRRQVYIFLMVEIVLAGLLVLLNLAIGTALVLVGFVMGFALWVYDQKPHWLPARLHVALKGPEKTFQDSPFEYDGCVYRSDVYVQTNTGGPYASVNCVFIGVRNTSERTALDVNLSVCQEHSRIPTPRFTCDGAASIPPGGTEFFHVFTFCAPGTSYGPSMLDAVSAERFEELRVQGSNWVTWFVSQEDRRFNLWSYLKPPRTPPERLEVSLTSANQRGRSGLVSIAWAENGSPVAVIDWF